MTGGYQIFSMGYGSVSNEIKGKRNVNGKGAWKKSLEVGTRRPCPPKHVTSQDAHTDVA